MAKDQIRAESNDQREYRLTEAQAEEVRCRLAKRNPNYISLDEARLLLRRTDT
jgi:hypothetical protein